MMKKQIDIPVALYDDDVVCFIAERYHISSYDVIMSFLISDGIITDAPDIKHFQFEDNEIEILRGLIKLNTPITDT